MTELPPSLASLGSIPQWILWRPTPDPATGKIIKKPASPHTGIIHDPHDSAIWVTSEQAIAALVAYPGYGIGFVFTGAIERWFFDIDNCMQSDGNWTPLALEMCTRFAGCAIEVSQSGTGLHIFGVGAIPNHACKNTALGLELYHDKRFAAITGTGAMGDSGAMAPVGTMEWLVNNYFPPSAITANPDNWRNVPIDEWNGPDDDGELINKMLASQSIAAAFGGKASFAALWDADAAVLGDFYPDGGTRAYDASSADAALCAHLAWWTGHDCDRMDRLFRRSKLYREKWEKRSDYRHATILKSVASCTGCYTQKKTLAVPDAPTTALSDTSGISSDPTYKDGSQYMTPEQQIEYFKGCVYLQVPHRMFTPNGMMLKTEQFKAMYGGYEFAMDAENRKQTTSAYECFTESKIIKFPKATNVVFRPEKKPGGLIMDEGLVMLNNYIPIKIDRIKGDASPFTGLMIKLFPDERDREIITSYMAACVQYPGKKFQWAPLIQGCEGNGKSFLITAVSKTIGIRYTHLPPAKDISNIFNAWICGKLFIGVEEVYVHDNKEVMDALKVLITNRRVPVTPKGVDQTTGDNRANFMATSNHKNAIRVAKKNNRRWCIFYTPQQSVDDINNDGMGGLYFPNLWAWFDADGAAIIADYLLSYRISDEFNPATLCHRAPSTSSASDIQEATMGGIEQEIFETIGEGRPGFANGWISSMALAQLIGNRRISHNKRSEILTELGFIPHPHLKDGRVNTIIPLDGGKPRLYVKSDSPHASITQPPEIIKQYLLSQSG